MNKIDRYMPAPGDTTDVGDTRSASFDRGDGDAGEVTGFSISIADLRTMAWRQRWLIGTLTAIAIVIGLIVTLLATPIYESTATVQIKQETTKIVSGQDVNPQDTVADSGRYLKTQEQIVSSRSLAERVSRSLKLADNDNFLVAMGAKPVAATVPASQRHAVRQEAVIASLLGHLKVTVPLDSRIAKIAFRSPDPVTATRVAQSYALNYVQSNIDTSFQSTIYARSFLADQVQQARDRLTASERRAIEYARNAQLIDASDAASSSADSQKRSGSSLTTASLVTLNDDLNAARAQLIEAEGRWRTAQATPAMQLPEVSQNATVNALQSSKSNLTGQLQLLRTRYRPDHPDVKALTAQIRTIDGDIDRIANNVRQTLRNAYDIAQRKESELDGAIRAARTDVLTEQQRRVELNVLSQDTEINRATLNDLLRRYNEINAAAGITANNLTLVDPAVQPRAPVSPRPLYNMGLALAIGLVAGFALAIVREATNDTVRSPEDVERKLGQPVLGATPKVKTDNAMTTSALLTDPSSSLSESYFSIRAALDYSTPRGRPRTLLVTSSASSEGKSTTALALAVDYARIGLRTLLVDADLRRPNVHRLMQLPNKRGFMDVLMEHCRLEEVIQRVPESTLDILTLGKIVANPVQVLSSDAVPKMLDTYRDRYDVIIFDTAPVMGIADTPLIARVVEGIVVVVEAGRAHRGQAKTTLKRLQEVGGNIVGVVLSKFDSRDAGYAYDYYNYYYSYSEDRKT